MTTRTTADLRSHLFDCLEQVKAGTMDVRQAAQVAALSREIVNTARLELDHSKILSRLDKDGQDVTTGPILLTDQSREAE